MNKYLLKYFASCVVSRHAVPRGLVASCSVLLVVTRYEQRWH